MAENGKLRPQNYTDPTQVNMEIKTLYSPANTTSDVASQDPCELLNCSSIKEEGDGDGDQTEELYTTIKIMASEAGKPKCPDVRFGINQHYPSFKPPPFPYHSRTPADSVASATNFTTHNIPQTFSTAIRCTKCGNSFDNMPELHKHILACANASDKRRYTPKKNPIPLRQIVAQPQNGVFLPIVPTSSNQNAFHRIGQTERLNFTQDVQTRIKGSALKKKKNQLVHMAICQKNKAAISVKKVSTQKEEQDLQACPYCSREFTYAASLAKHIACSCPQKPVAKKKNLAPMPKDKKSKLRSQSTVSEIKKEANLTSPVKPLGKTRSQSLELVEGDVTSGCNGKTDTLQICVKRPTLNKDHSAPKNKKGRNSKPETSVMTSSLTYASQPSAKMQIIGKAMALKKEAVTKPQVQSKKEKCFLKRMRERIGGPVTRSLQIANATPSEEVKAENQPISEPVSEEHKVHIK
ncbi:PR domain zinc finger protein 2 [Bagarius yarrelli]|uniref:PR domain zinc finger protein 2 n=1 Tax=Bagarius yarrelli TaxID=175774 RepID=A0A556V3X3_BAGYA|nr:PR domain zinc finger protein 2 [Bagarius yarrelli]